MTTTKYDNCGILTKMGDNSTHDGSRKPPVDGVDFPHTGLIKLFDAQRYGYVILSKNATTGSTTSTAGAVFDCNFNISLDDTTSSGNTTVAVMSGSVIRNGKLVNVATGTSVGVGVHLTEVTTVATDGSHGNDTDGYTKFAEQGTTGQNFYHVIVVNHANAIRIRNPSAKDVVAELGAGDIPIAIMRVQNGETPTTRQIQYLGCDRRDGGLSLYYAATNVPTETGKIEGSATGTTITNSVEDLKIINTHTDKDIIFQVNDGGSAGTEVMRIDGENSRVGIGTNAPESNLHIAATASGAPIVTLDNTASLASAGGEPQLIFKRSGATAASGDIGGIVFKGMNDAGTPALFEFGRIFMDMVDETAGHEDGRMIINIAKASQAASSSTNTEMLRLSGPYGFQFNYNKEDHNFEVRGANNNNVLTVDASTDRVGIGVAEPSSALEIQDGLTTTGAVLTLSTKEPSVVANDVLGQINFQAPLDTGADSDLVGASIQALATDTFSDTVNATDLLLKTGASETATEKMRIKSDGKVGIGTTTPDTALEVSGVVTHSGTRGPVAIVNSASVFGSGGIYQMTTANNIIVCSSTGFAPGPPPSGGPVNITLPAASALTVGHQITIICTATAGGADPVDIDIGAGGNNILDENLTPLNLSGPHALIAGATYTVIGYDATTWLVIRLA